MATITRSTNRPPAEALVAGDRDLMKAPMKDALQELLSAAPNERSQTRSGYRAATTAALW
ncbi:hypothetical protein [Caballeronia sp. J97]|uniref:hypothetical protein n=1 Tax=Caballeronia sp. J97 TaxID=2805429 RepID=UPI0039EDEF56